MQIKNAIKKLEKAGFNVSSNGRNVTAKKGLQIISVSANGGDLSDRVATVRVRSQMDTDCSQTDYFAGVYCDSVTQAIKIVG
jgi:translation initiation factor IF-2